MSDINAAIEAVPADIIRFADELRKRDEKIAAMKQAIRQRKAESKALSDIYAKRDAALQRHAEMRSATGSSPSVSRQSNTPSPALETAAPLLHPVPEAQQLRPSSGPVPAATAVAGAAASAAAAAAAGSGKPGVPATETARAPAPPSSLASSLSARAPPSMSASTSSPAAGDTPAATATPGAATPALPAGIVQASVGSPALSATPVSGSVVPPQALLPASHALPRPAQPPRAVPATTPTGERVMLGARSGRHSSATLPRRVRGRLFVWGRTGALREADRALVAGLKYDWSDPASTLAAEHREPCLCPVSLFGVPGFAQGRHKGTSLSLLRQAARMASKRPGYGERPGTFLPGVLQAALHLCEDAGLELPVRQLSARGSATLLLTRAGDVFEWAVSDSSVLRVSEGVPDDEDEQATSKVRTTLHTVRVPRRLHVLSVHRALYRDPVVMVATGPQHALAVTRAGVLFTWGCADEGRLGHGTLSDMEAAAGTSLQAWHGPHKPAHQYDPGCLTTVDSGLAEALNAPATVLQGADEASNTASTQAGVQPDFSSTATHSSVILNMPMPVAALLGKPVTAVAAGGAHSIAVTADGAVYTWGRGKNGRLGHGDTRPQWEPKRVSGSGVSRMERRKERSTGLFGWFSGSSKHAGKGDMARPLEYHAAMGETHAGATAAEPIDAARPGKRWDTGTTLGAPAGEWQGCRIVRVAAGRSFSVALSARGEAWTWGRNTEGQCGQPPAHGGRWADIMAPTLVRVPAPPGRAARKGPGRGSSGDSAGAPLPTMPCDTPDLRSTPAFCSDLSPISSPSKGLAGLSSGQPSDAAATSPGNSPASAGMAEPWQAARSPDLGSALDETFFTAAPELAAPDPARDVRWELNDAALAHARTVVVAIAAGHSHVVALTADARVITWGFDGQGQAGRRSVAWFLPRGAGAEPGGSPAEQYDSSPPAGARPATVAEEHDDAGSVGWRSDGHSVGGMPWEGSSVAASAATGHSQQARARAMAPTYARYGASAYGSGKSRRASEATVHRNASGMSLGAASATSAHMAPSIAAPGVVPLGAMLAYAPGAERAAAGAHPVYGPGHDKVVRVVAGEQHSLAITQTGRVFAWGLNNSAELGVGHTHTSTRIVEAGMTVTHTPSGAMQVMPPTKSWAQVAAAAAGDDFSMIVEHVTPGGGHASSGSGGLASVAVAAAAGPGAAWHGSGSARGGSARAAEGAPDSPSGRYIHRAQTSGSELLHAAAAGQEVYTLRPDFQACSSDMGAMPAPLAVLSTAEGLYATQALVGTVHAVLPAMQARRWTEVDKAEERVSACDTPGAWRHLGMPAVDVQEVLHANLREARAHYSRVVRRWQQVVCEWPSTLRAREVAALQAVGPIPMPYRARVWPRLVGNALNVTPELFALSLARAAELHAASKGHASTWAAAGAMSPRLGAQLADESEPCSPCSAQRHRGFSFEATPDAGQQHSGYARSPAGQSSRRAHRSKSVVRTTAAGEGLERSPPPPIRVGGQTPGLLGGQQGRGPGATVATPAFSGKEASMQLIGRDLPRTFSHTGLFQPGGVLHRALAVVLHAVTIARPELGYVQSMSYLGAMVVLHVPDPPVAFQTLLNLLARPHMYAAQTMDAVLVRRLCDAFYAVLRQVDPATHAALVKHSFLQDASVFLLPWIQTLFIKLLPLHMAAAVWDAVMADGAPAIVRAGIAILKLLRESLQSASEEAATAMLTSPASAPEAWQVVRTPKFMRTMAAVALTDAQRELLVSATEDAFFWAGSTLGLQALVASRSPNSPSTPWT